MLRESTKCFSSEALLATGLNRVTPVLPVGSASALGQMSQPPAEVNSARICTDKPDASSVSGNGGIPRTKTTLNKDVEHVVTLSKCLTEGWCSSVAYTAFSLHAQQSKHGYRHSVSRQCSVLVRQLDDHY